MSEVDSTAHELATQFYALNEYLRTNSDGVSAVQRLVNLAIVTVPGCQWAGVTAWDQRRGASSLASSDPITQTVDDIQHTLGEGPCVTAATEADLEPVLADDLRADTRWPTFAREVLEKTPVRSVLAFHLNGVNGKRCALNLYGPRPKAFSEEALSVSALFATHARALMLHSASAEQVANLNEALTRSREIGTAVGILMAMHRVTSEGAFEMLSRASQDLNRKLRDVAADVTRTGALPEPLRSRGEAI